MGHRNGPGVVTWRTPRKICEAPAATGLLLAAAAVFGGLAGGAATGLAAGGEAPPIAAASADSLKVRLSTQYTMPPWACCPAPGGGQFFRPLRGLLRLAATAQITVTRPQGCARSRAFGQRQTMGEQLPRGLELAVAGHEHRPLVGCQVITRIDVQRRLVQSDGPRIVQSAADRVLAARADCKRAQPYSASEAAGSCPPAAASCSPA